MTSNYSYIISLMDEITQEPIHILVNGQRELSFIISRLPEHHIFVSSQNIGVITNKEDYLKSLNDDMNFGGN